MDSNEKDIQKTAAPQGWGVIYCPRESTPKRWEHIRQILEQSDLPYDYVQSDGEGAIERLAGMMTRNGYSTIIVVGGDSALNHALNGILKNTSPTGKIPAIGVIPNGHINDFARYWGFHPKNDKETIDRLAKNRKRRIDVGVLTTHNKDAKSEETVSATAYFLNCVNIGTAASIIHLRRQAHSHGWFSKLSYVWACFQLLFQRMNFKYAFSLNGEQHERKGMTLCVGSARGYGQTPNAVPYNGLLDISLVSAPQLTQLFHGLWLLVTGRFLSHTGIKVWRTNKMDFSDIDGARISYDGHVHKSGAESLTISILPEKVEFLI